MFRIKILMPIQSSVPTISSPVHVVLVTLLVDQLSGLFLIFWGRPKNNLSSLRSFFVHSLEFFIQSFSKNEKLTGQLSPVHVVFVSLDKFFFGRPKKKRNRLDNWLSKRLTKTTWTGLLSAKRLTKTTFSKKTGQKIQESKQKRSDTGQIFVWLTKKNEK